MPTQPNDVEDVKDIEGGNVLLMEEEPEEGTMPQEPGGDPAQGGDSSDPAADDGIRANQWAEMQRETNSSDPTESHSFVKTVRREYMRDHNLEYGRDVNVTSELEGRASRNVRVRFAYSIFNENDRYPESYQFPFRGGPREREDYYSYRMPSNHPVEPIGQPGAPDTPSPRLVLQPDSNTAIEDQKLTSTGNVFDNDTNTKFAKDVVIAPSGGSAAGGSSASGQYGSVVINPDGTYTYTLNNDSPGVQSLAEGQQVEDVFVVSVTDRAGRVVETTLTIKVTGANDAPIISITGSDSDVAILDETDTGLSAAGTLTLTDVDTDDAVSSSVVSVEVSGDTNGLSVSEADILRMLTTGGAEIASGANEGKINWSFDSGSEAFDYLGYDEKLVFKYTVRATDNSGTSNDTSNEKTITVTINGKNDAPEISVTAGDTDEATFEETDDGLQAEGKLTLTDIDIRDNVTVGVTGVDISGDKVGLVPTPEQILAMLNLSGGLSSTEDGGKIDWTFDSGTEAFDYLNPGEKLVLTYTIQANDNTGAPNDSSNLQTITITINGTEDSPVVTDVSLEGFTEDAFSAGTGDTLTGNVFDGDESTGPKNTGLHVTEFENSDGMTTSVSRSGNVSLAGNYGTLEIAADGTYTYAADNAKLQELKEGQKETDVFTIEVTNAMGETSVKTFEVGVTGVNDQPTISVRTDVASTDKNAHGFNENDSLKTDGTLTVEDVDTKDIVGVAFEGAEIGSSSTYSGTIPEWLNENAIRDMMKFEGLGQMLDDTETLAAGGLKWEFDADSHDFDFLSEGETIVLEYELKVTDSQNASDTEKITITIIGKNDAPEISVTAGDTIEVVREETDEGLQAEGKLTLTDIDIRDNVTVGVVDVDISGDKGGLLPTPEQILAMLNLSGGLSPTEDGGKIDWTFDSGTEAFDYLNPDEKLVLTYTIQANDNTGTSNASSNLQTITITINGTEDRPVVTDVSLEGFTEDAFSVGTGDTLTGNVFDVDESTGPKNTGLHVTEFENSDGTEKSVPGSGNVSLAGNYGTLEIAADGTYTYTADNAKFQELEEGQTDKDIFTIEVTNAMGEASVKTFEVGVTGVNDQPTISVRTDLAPTDKNAHGFNENDSLKTDGTLTVEDVDTKDIVGVTFEGAEIGSSSTYSGTIPEWLNENAILDMITFEGLGQIIDDTETLAAGGVKWEFDADSHNFVFLPAGKTIVLEYTVKATDSQNASDTEKITITITGTNSAPSITVGTGDNASAGLTETNDPLTTFGTLTITDPDIGDTHTVEDVSEVKVAYDENDFKLPARLDTDAFLDMIEVKIDNATGKVVWEFNSDTEAFDFLPDGKILTLTYEVEIKDAAGVSATKEVTITITGTNDAPVANPDKVTINEDFDVTGNVILGTDPVSEATGHDPNYLEGEAGSTSDVVNGIDVTGADYDDVAPSLVSFSMKGTYDSVANVFTPDENGEAHTFTVPKGGELTVKIADVGSITMGHDGSYHFVPDGDYHGSVPEITYTISSSDHPDDLASSTLNITVDPQAGGASWGTTATDIKTPEDTAKELGLKTPLLTDTDGERIGEITIGAIPDGAVIRVGDGGEVLAATGGKITIVIVDEFDVLDTSLHYGGLSTTGVYTLTRTEYEALKITPPADSSTDFKLQLDMTSYKVTGDGDAKTPIDKDNYKIDIPMELDVVVTPVTDKPDLSFDDAYDYSADTGVNGTNVKGWDGTNGTLKFDQDKPVDLAPFLNLSFPAGDGTGAGDTKDSSEERWIEITGLPKGFTLKIGDASPITITDPKTPIRVELIHNSSTGTYEPPELILTPLKFYCNCTTGIEKPDTIAITLYSWDRDEDDSSKRGDQEKSSVDIKLEISPVAGDIKCDPPEEGGIEDHGSAIYFLSGLVVTDREGDEGIGASGDNITEIRVMTSSIPTGWVIYYDGDLGGGPAAELVSDADGDYYKLTQVGFDGTTEKHLKYYIQPDTPESKDAIVDFSGLVETLEVHVQTVDGDDTVSTWEGGEALEIPLVILPVAEIVQGSDPNDCTIKIDGVGKDFVPETAYTGANPDKSNSGLTMNGNHVYHTALVPGGHGSEYYVASGEPFDLNNDFDLKASWANPDDSEQTFALFTPKLLCGFDGERNIAYGGDEREVIGAIFTYVGPDGPVSKTYNGKPVEIPIEYLDTLTFKVPEGIYGELKIEVQAYTVDSMDVNGTTYTSTAVSGLSVLSGVFIDPVATKVTFKNVANQNAYEDNYDRNDDKLLTELVKIDTGEDDYETRLYLSIKPILETNDIYQSFTISLNLEDLPAGCEIWYGGTKIDPVINGDGKPIAALPDFDEETPLYIAIPKNLSFSLADDVKVYVTAESVVNWDYKGDNSIVITSHTTDVVTDISLEVFGVPNDEPLITIFDPSKDAIPSEYDGSASIENLDGKDVLAFDESFVEKDGIPLANIITKVELHDLDGSETLTIKIAELEFSNSNFSEKDFQLISGSEEIDPITIGGETTWNITIPITKGMDEAAIKDAINDLLDNAHIKVPPNYNGSVSFKIIPITTDGGNAAEWYDEGKVYDDNYINTVTFLVKPTPEASINTTMEIDEDTSVLGVSSELKQVDFSIEYENGDDSEEIHEVWVKASDIDAQGDFVLYLGNDGSVTLKEAAENGSEARVSIDGDYYVISKDALENIFIGVKENFAGEIKFDIKYKVTDFYDAENGTTWYKGSDPVTGVTDFVKTADEKYVIKVNPVTDPTEMESIGAGDIGDVIGTTVTGGTGGTIPTVTITTDVAGNKIPVTVRVAMPSGSDTDNSEQLLYFVIDGVPDGVTIENATYLGKEGDTLQGDSNSANGKGRWLIAVTPQNFTGTDSQQLTFNLQINTGSRNLWDLPNTEEVLLTVSAISRDTATIGEGAGAETIYGKELVSDSSVTANLNLVFDFGSGPGQPIKPYPAAEVTATMLNPIMEDPAADAIPTLSSLLELTFKPLAVYGVDGNIIDPASIEANPEYAFKITLEGLAPGTTMIKGGIEYTVGSNGEYVIEGYGTEQDANDLLGQIQIIPPLNFNDNHFTTGKGLVVTCVTEGYGGNWGIINDKLTLDESLSGSSTSTKTSEIGDFIKPVTDGVKIEIDSQSVIENQAGETNSTKITISLDNSADREFAGIDGKLYLLIADSDVEEVSSGVFRLVNGTLMFGSTALAPEKITPTGLSEGYYIVIDLAMQASDVLDALKTGGAGPDKDYTGKLELEFTPKEFWAGSLKLEAFIPSQEENAANTNLGGTTGSVDVDAVNSGATWNAAATAVGDEDTVKIEGEDRSIEAARIVLNDPEQEGSGLGLQLVDPDGSEGFTSTITITVENGHVVMYKNAGGEVVAANPSGSSDGSTTYIVPIGSDGKLPYIAIQTPQFVSGDNFEGTINFNTGEITGGKILEQTPGSFDFTYTSNPVANGFNVFKQSTMIRESSGNVELTLNAAMYDTDGSEVAVIRLSSIGPEAVFFLEEGGTKTEISQIVNGAFDDANFAKGDTLAAGITIYYDHVAGTYTLVGVTNEQLSKISFTGAAYANREVEVNMWTVEVSADKTEALTGLSDVTTGTIVFSDKGSGNVPNLPWPEPPMGFSTFAFEPMSLMSFAPLMGELGDEASESCGLLGGEPQGLEMFSVPALLESDVVAASAYEADDTGALGALGELGESNGVDGLDDFGQLGQFGQLDQPDQFDQSGDDGDFSASADGIDALDGGDGLAMFLDDEPLDIFGEFGEFGEANEFGEPEEFSELGELAGVSELEGVGEMPEFADASHADDGDVFSHEGMDSSADGSTDEGACEAASLSGADDDGANAFDSADVSGSDSGDVLSMTDVFDVTGEGTLNFESSFEANLIGESSPVAESPDTFGDQLDFAFCGTPPVEDELARQLTSSNG